MQLTFLLSLQPRCCHVQQHTQYGFSPHLYIRMLYSLPIESGGGQVVVEESVRGRKKEAVFQCALKACRILDSNDMLRAASQS